MTTAPSRPRGCVVRQPAICRTTTAASRTPICADLSARTTTRAAGGLRPVRLCPRRVPRNRLNVTGSLRQEISFRAFPGRGLIRYTRVAAASFLTAVFLFSSEIGSIGTAAAQTPTDGPKISTEIQAILKPVAIVGGDSELQKKLKERHNAAVKILEE